MKTRGSGLERGIVIWVLATVGCGDWEEDPDPVPASDLSVTPEVLSFCCDPEAAFPQRVGNVVFTNAAIDEDLLEPEVRISSGDPDVVSMISTIGSDSIDIDSTLTDTLSVMSCGDKTVVYEVSVEPVFTHTVEIEDRCPSSVDDPLDPALDPSLDLRGCDAAVSAGGQPWIGCDVEGSWPPDQGLFSWFARCSLQDSGGATTNDCTVQRHDGVDMSFCDVGNVADFSSLETATGFVCVFDNASAGEGTGFAISTGVLPTEAGKFASDDLLGTFGTDLIDVPSGP